MNLALNATSLYIRHGKYVSPQKMYVHREIIMMSIIRIDPGI